MIKSYKATFLFIILDEEDWITCAIRKTFQSHFLQIICSCVGTINTNSPLIHVFLCQIK